MRLMTLPPFVLFVLLALTACPLPDDTGDTSADECLIGTVLYLNEDGDDFGGDTAIEHCLDPPEFRPATYSAFTGDCDDDNDKVHPDADEVCDGMDNDCDGAVDVDALDAVRWYADNDGDGYGGPLWGPLQCDQPAGYVDNGDDCDDNNAQIYPGVQGCE